MKCSLAIFTVFWKAGRVVVRSGASTEKSGRILGSWYMSLSMVPSAFSTSTTDEMDASEPAAAVVASTPKGKMALASPKMARR